MGDSVKSSSVQVLPTEPSASETIQFVSPPDSPVFAEGFSSGVLPLGTHLGHYIVKKYIGGGGMGHVYLATDSALDRNVAIKVLSQQRGSGQGIVARFMNEAKSAARLNHEHIAQVYFAGEESGIPFIAFEYVEGINVRTMIEEHDVFPLPQALNYLLQITHALAHAAVHGVVHRDVKPSNILITREGRAKLIDMGLARLQDSSEARNDLTASGVTLGTFDYISPEQARDPRNADIRSDIYSLGCTFFFMLTGRPPFPEGTVLQKLLQHQGDAPPDIRSFQPGIPVQIALLIQKMMAKDPKQRFQTPDQLIEALTFSAKQLGLRPAGQGNLVWTPMQSKRTTFFLRHIPWITAVSSLLLAFLLMTLFSEQFGSLHLPGLPDSDQPVPSIVTETTVLPTESIGNSSSAFDVSFVSRPSTQQPTRFSTGLGTKSISGGLQPAFSAPQFSVTKSGRLDLADLNLKAANSTEQLLKPPTEIRCVDPNGETIGSYPSLTSALTEAPDGTVIELKWNSIIERARITEPVLLANRRLKIVAAEGYDPVLMFEPGESQNARSFFSLFNSSVEFRHVGIEIRLNPNVLSPHWSLFELTGNNELSFLQCCLTVRNKSMIDDSVYHDDAVFFRNIMPVDAAEHAAVSEPVAEPETKPLKLQITDSVLRGEATALQTGVPQDVYVQVSNSFIVLAKPFIHTEEYRRETKSGAIRIEWNKVVFFGRQWVVLRNRDASVTESVKIDFEAKQSVFVLSRSPFAVFRGIFSPSKTLEYFHWSGTGNYFQGITSLRFRSLSAVSAEDSDMPLNDWQRFWDAETNRQTKIDVLSFYEMTKPMFRFAPQDVILSSDSMETVPLPALNWFPGSWQ